MECKDTLACLPAHIDHELGARDAAELERHLAHCHDCQSQLQLGAAMHAATAATATLHRAPAGLEQRILAALPDAPENAATRPSPPRSGWSWLNWGSVMVTASAVAWSVGLTVLQPSASDLLVDNIVSSHMRASLTQRLTDVASSDQHTVKPWFAGKLDYSPPVRDTAAQGFSLTGARVDYVDHRPVAALVYARRLHVIDLFVLPTDAEARSRRIAGEQSLSRQGYQVVHWTRDGMSFWAVSDVGKDELEQFRDLLLAAPL